MCRQWHCSSLARIRIGCRVATGAISTKAINKQNTQLFTHKTTLSFRVFCYGTHSPQFDVVVSIFATEILSTHCQYEMRQHAPGMARSTAFEKCKFFQSVSLQFILFVSVLFNISSSPTLNLGFEKFPVHTLTHTPSFRYEAVKIDDGFGSGWACKDRNLFSFLQLYFSMDFVLFTFARRLHSERGGKRTSIFFIFTSSGKGIFRSQKDDTI